MVLIYILLKKDLYILSECVFPKVFRKVARVGLLSIATS